MSELAIFGGTPARTRPWPEWPRPETAARAPPWRGRP